MANSFLQYAINIKLNIHNVLFMNLRIVHKYYTYVVHCCPVAWMAHLVNKNDLGKTANRKLI